jgi:hypothetical protein
MASLFYATNESHKVIPNLSNDINENYIDSFNSARPGVYFLPYLFQKYLDSSYSRLFAQTKLTSNIKYMDRGYYPNNLMSDITKAELHYQKLNDMLKLE